MYMLYKIGKSEEYKEHIKLLQSNHPNVGTINILGCFFPSFHFSMLLIILIKKRNHAIYIVLSQCFHLIHCDTLSHVT